MAVLRSTDGGREFPLQGKVIVLGRDQSCDIVSSHPGASARHALIVNTNGNYYIEDLDSVNGTTVDGKRISQRTRLCASDHVQIPGLSVTFHDDDKTRSTKKSDTVQLPESLLIAGSAPIMSSIDIAGDLRLTVKPEAKLRAVLEMSKNLSNTLDLKVVLPKTLDSLFAIFPQADCGFILLRDANTGQLVPRAVKHRRESSDTSVPISRGIIDHVLKSGRAILSADAGSDERFDTSQSISHLKIRSIMCVPMLCQTGSCIGVIQIDTRDRRNQFQQEELDLLACASIQAARTVELAQLHEERRDLEAATRIQKSFLPSERPKSARLEFFDFYSPALHVGGDYYDYVPLPGNRLAVALGDVAGKGISAALLMARLSAAARFALATTTSVSEAVRQLNQALIHSGSEDRFVTFVVAVIDLAQSQLTLVNAGHLPPLLCRSGKPPEEIGEAVVGLPLAVMDRDYEELVVPFKPGDTMMFYTDGVSEMRNQSGEMYGTERLYRVIERAPPNAEGLGNAVLKDVRQFAGDRPQNDDLTIVCFRCTC